MPDPTRDKLRASLLASRDIMAQIKPRSPLYHHAQERIAEIDAILAAKAGRPGKIDLAKLLELLAAGKTTSEIAAELGVTPSAIRQAKQKRK